MVMRVLGFDLDFLLDKIAYYKSVTERHSSDYYKPGIAEELTPIAPTYGFVNNARDSYWRTSTALLLLEPSLGCPLPLGGFRHLQERIKSWRRVHMGCQQ